jgi:hypothetical protein
MRINAYVDRTVIAFKDITASHEARTFIGQHEEADHFDCYVDGQPINLEQLCSS